MIYFRIERKLISILGERGGRSGNCLLYIVVIFANYVRKRARSCNIVQRILVGVRVRKVAKQDLLFVLSDVLLPLLFVLPLRILNHLQSLPSGIQLHQWCSITSFAMPARVMVDFLISILRLILFLLLRTGRLFLCLLLFQDNLLFITLITYWNYYSVSKNSCTYAFFYHNSM